MSKEVNPKHSVGRGPQRAQHNEPNEKSYTNAGAKEEVENTANDDDYLEKKWKKIASNFNKKYNLDVSSSEMKENSFSDTLKNLEERTGKSGTDLKKEIENWKE
ncbi:hypothetical protein QRD02_05055 [Aequorivita sp. SDUM287046]|uniref:General stress protein CsbD n=1 Tax=Aequorivita aurantiaca TaxID=3053356 RepID=A0ABT8DKR8_9FLAO|nr:hypothetical protein [Aequorivita aurantiaca]MDN3723740.1 hypothetical protein [Aequorivita aurantiaca]